MAIKIITPPAVEPISLQEAKLHSRVNIDTEESLIHIWIKSGRILAEKFQNRSFVKRELELTLDAWPRSPFELPRPPLINVVSIKYYDTENHEETVDAGDYFVDTDSEPGRVSLAYEKRWPTETILRPISGVKIRFEAGYGATADHVPQNVKDALLLYVTYRYEHRAEEMDEESAPSHFYNLLWPDRMCPV